MYENFTDDQRHTHWGTSTLTAETNHIGPKLGSKNTTGYRYVSLDRSEEKQKRDNEIKYQIPLCNAHNVFRGPLISLIQIGLTSLCLHFIFFLKSVVLLVYCFAALWRLTSMLSLKRYFFIQPMLFHLNSSYLSDVGSNFCCFVVIQ